MATGIIGVISAGGGSSSSVTYSPSSDSKLAISCGSVLSQYSCWLSINGVQVHYFWGYTSVSTDSHVEFYMWVRSGSSVTITVSSGVYSGTIGAVISALES